MDGRIDIVIYSYASDLLAPSPGWAGERLLGRDRKRPVHANGERLWTSKALIVMMIIIIIIIIISVIILIIMIITIIIIIILNIIINIIMMTMC